MSFHHLDQFAATTSPVTRLPPVIRVLGTIVIALGVSSLPLGAWPQLAAMVGLAAILCAAARVPPLTLLRRMAGPLLFVLLASVALLFLVPGETVLSFAGLGVSGEGVVRFGSALGRAAVALAAAVILVSTTRFPELVQALRKLRLPRAVTAALALAYRLLYIMVDEVERMRRAARSRNAGGGAAKRRSLLAGVAVAALRRVLVRSEHTHRAMLSRGFQGDVVPLHESNVNRRSIAVLCTLTLIVAAIVASAHLIG